MNIDTNQFAVILSRGWWVLLLRGVLAILFGVVAWFSPQVSLVLLIMLFGIYVLADGVLGVIAAITERKQQQHWLLMLLWGLVGVAVGVVTLAAPSVTAVALMYYIAIWAIATGVLQILAAVRLRKEIRGEWLLILGGVASVVFGGLIMAQPLVGALAVLWLIATYAVIFGLILVALAFKARGFAKRISG